MNQLNKIVALSASILISITGYAASLEDYVLKAPFKMGKIEAPVFPDTNFQLRIMVLKAMDIA